MAAANTDKFKKLTNNFSTTLSGAIVGAGDSSMSLASTTNLHTDTGTVFVIDRVNSSGVATPSLREYVVGTVSGSNVTNLVRGVGNSTAQAHSNGAVVEQVVDERTLNDIVDGLLVSHNQDGTMIANLPLATPKVTTGIKDANGNTMFAFTATASAVNAFQLTNAATGNDPVIAPGGPSADSARNLNLRGKGLAKTVTIGAGAQPVFAYDYVASGCVLSGTGYGSTLAWSMTSGVVVINGNPITVASASGTVTASKDTYFDILDNGDGTGLLVNTSGNIVANNAASPALASNSIRIGIIVSGANIANSGSVNQGQETMVLPIASSVPYAVTDSLGNLICPRDPNRKLLGQRQITGNITTTSNATAVQATGLSVPVIVPSGRKIVVSVYIPRAQHNSAGQYFVGSLWDGTVGSGTQIVDSAYNNSGANTGGALPLTSPAITPSSSSKTYNVGFCGTSTNTTTMAVSATSPAYIKVELV